MCWRDLGGVGIAWAPRCCFLARARRPGKRRWRAPGWGVPRCAPALHGLLQDCKLWAWEVAPGLYLGWAAAGCPGCAGRGAAGKSGPVAVGEGGGQPGTPTADHTCLYVISSTHQQMHPWRPRGGARGKGGGPGTVGKRVGGSPTVGSHPRWVGGEGLSEASPHAGCLRWGVVLLGDARGLFTMHSCVGTACAGAGALRSLKPPLRGLQPPECRPWRSLQQVLGQGRDCGAAATGGTVSCWWWCMHGCTAAAAVQQKR